MIEITYLLCYLGELSFIGSAAGFAYLFKYLTSPQKALFFYCLIGCLVGIWKLQVLLTITPNTLWILNLYLIAEVVLLMWYFRESSDTKRAKQIFTGLAVLLGGLSIFLYKTEAVSEASWINAIGIIGGVFYQFYQMLENPSEKSLIRQPIYWFNSGILVYFTGSFFIFLHNRYVFTYGNESALYIEGFRYLLLIARNVLFCIGIWQIRPHNSLRNVLLGGWAVAFLWAMLQYAMKR